MNDAALVEELARLSCRESHACGINWMFAPLHGARRLRWGRTYEALEDPAVVAEPRQRRCGTQTCGVPMAACVKHRVADGATALGTGTKDFEDGAPVGVLDQGDAQIDERELRERHVAAYLPALAASGRGAADGDGLLLELERRQGARVALPRHDAAEGGARLRRPRRLRLQRRAAVLPRRLQAALALALNAGIDMVMTACMYGDVLLAEQLEVAERAVGEGLVPMARIEDAVRRILRVKAAMRLDDAPTPQPGLDCAGCAAHRATARAAVRKSLALLRNERRAAAAAAALLVAGRGAHDLGMQCGGWSMEWLGFRGNEAIEGTTIYDGVRAACAGAVLPRSEAPPLAAAAPVALVVVGERTPRRPATPTTSRSTPPTPRSSTRCTTRRARGSSSASFSAAGRSCCRRRSSRSSTRSSSRSPAPRAPASPTSPATRRLRPPLVFVAARQFAGAARGARGGPAV